MSQPVQGDDSSTLGVLSVKRKRGRPRKEKSMNRMEITRMPPGFRVKENLHERADTNDGMVGQAVSGVVEAVFDAGYFLTVRIGNSGTNLRGVVFKPGHCVPVTAENDVAPLAQMIPRNDQIIMPGHNGSKSGSQQNGSLPANHVYGLVQYTTNKTAARGRYAAPIAPSVPLVGARGTVVPVVLQPANLSTPRHHLSLRDDEVHAVQPLAMLPPDASAPTSQMSVPENQSLPSQSHTGQQASEGNVQNTNGSLNRGANIATLAEEGKPNTPDEHTEDPQRSSPSSLMKDDITASQSLSREPREPNLLQERPFQTANSSLHMQSTSVSKPLKNFATGRMTELLLAVQENMTDKQVAHVEYL